MKIVFWNCRGLGTPRTIRELRETVASTSPQILGLAETKSNVLRLESVRLKLGFGGCFAVSSKGSSGGLALLWRTDVDVQVLSYSFYHIDFLVNLKSCIRYTLFYGAPRSNIRHLSWDLMRRLSKLYCHPWCIFGDFNEIRKSNEATHLYYNRGRQMENFNRAIYDCRLFDLGCQGDKYTYSNKRKNNNEVRCRLDRALATSNWLHIYPHFSVRHLVAYSSDHKKLLINMMETGVIKSKMFRFERMWMRHDDYKHFVEREWSQVRQGSGSFTSKLKCMQQKFSQWNKVAFGDVKQQLKILQLELGRVQQGVRNDSSIRKEEYLISQIDEWLRREEILWHQRSRINWLKEGDNNSRFFHAVATARRRNNMIDSLQKPDGTLTTHLSEIMRLAVDFYKDLFSSSTQMNKDKLKPVLNFIPRKVTDAQNSVLLSPYTEDEVTRAVFQINPGKAPGIDGFPASYFQKSWTIVKEDVLTECLSFLNTGVMHPDNNITMIALIPKLKAAQKIADYRPISLIGVIAKVISKVMANRLQNFLNEIISPEQCAFLKNRLISDNILIAQEVSHFIRIHNSRQHAYGALKLDMAKAYDKIEWPFLEEILLQLGFAPAWVKMVMQYVSTAKYCLRINGEISEFFEPSRGLRQGDPLSPYLFILCTEWLSHTFKHYERIGLLQGVRICRRAPSITHLLFADDCLIFFRVTDDSIRSLKYLLDLYETISGQTVNYQKSELVLSSSVPQYLSAWIDANLGVRIVDKLSKYLGLPLQFSKRRSDTFLPILDKMRNKVSGWKASSLSSGGKEVLITAVLNAIPQYWLSCFLLPEKLIHNIHRLINNFWWGDSNKKRPLHWIRGEELRKDKELGGLGFRDIKSLNMAYLAKQAWRIATQPHLLISSLLKAKYFSNTHILQSNKGYRASPIWQGIHKSLYILEKGSDVDMETGELIWKVSNSTAFELKSAYKLAHQLHAADSVQKAEQSDSSHIKNFWKTIWKLPLPKKIKIFVWRGYHGALATGKEMRRRHLQGALNCVICNYHTEDAIHIFARCWWSKSLWSHLGIGNSAYFDRFSTFAVLPT